MALNPPLDPQGNPCRVNGEYFILKRTGVEFEFKVSGGNKYTGKGRVNKIIIINNNFIDDSYFSSCYMHQRKK
jgi:hypothetical protein